MWWKVITRLWRRIIWYINSAFLLIIDLIDLTAINFNYRLWKNLLQHCVDSNRLKTLYRVKMETRADRTQTVSQGVNCRCEVECRLESIACIRGIICDGISTVGVTGHTSSRRHSLRRLSPPGLTFTSHSTQMVLRLRGSEDYIRPVHGAGNVLVEQCQRLVRNKMNEMCV